jgi:hypothetical protein
MFVFHICLLPDRTVGFRQCDAAELRAGRAGFVDRFCNVCCVLNVDFVLLVFAVSRSDKTGSKKKRSYEKAHCVFNLWVFVFCSESCFDH